MVNTYGVTRLDFDIEGGVLSDTAATSLRDQALAALQAEDPSVQVDFTLAVAPQGLPTGTGSEYALLQDAKAKGVKVSVVNIMTMDFGAGSNDLADAESAAQGTAGQLSGLYGISTSAAYGMMGLTPIAGTNDDGTVLLHLERPVAGELRRVQRRRGTVLLGGRRLRQADRLPVLVDLQPDHRQQRRRWRRLRPPGRSPGTRACAWMTASASTADFNPIQVYTCNGTNAQQWTVESQRHPEVLGKCLDVDARGHRQRHHRRPVPLQRHRRAVLGSRSPTASLLNPNSGKCLDDTGYGGSGTQVQIWACADTANQQWNLP